MNGGCEAKTQVDDDDDVTHPYALRRRMHPQLHPRSCPRHVNLDLMPYLLIQAVSALCKCEIDE